MPSAPSNIRHEDVGPAVYAAIPPRSVPWRKRLFWHLVLGCLRSSVARRGLMRLLGR